MTCILQSTLDVLLRAWPGSGAAIDLGCADGWLASYVAARGWRVTGVDRLVTGDDPRVTWVTADMRDLSLPAASYELVIARYSLQALLPSERERVLADCWQTLRCGGIFLILGFSTRDPLCRVARETHCREPEPWAFEMPGGVFSFLEPEKLERWAASVGGFRLVSREFDSEEDHPPEGRHRHSSIFLAVQKR